MTLTVARVTDVNNVAKASITDANAGNNEFLTSTNSGLMTLTNGTGGAQKRAKVKVTTANTLNSVDFDPADTSAAVAERGTNYTNGDFVLISGTDASVQVEHVHTKTVNPINSEYFETTIGGITTKKYGNTAKDDYIGTGQSHFTQKGCAAKGECRRPLRKWRASDLCTDTDSGNSNCTWMHRKKRFYHNA